MKTTLFLASCFLTLSLGCATDDEPMGIDLSENNVVPPTCVATSEEEVNCSDGIDDNCDGRIDCENLSCAFEAACVARNDMNVDGTCGEATYAGNPLAIPDGDGASYETSVLINGFDDGQTLDMVTGFVSACVVMEHSFLRDLQIEMDCPSGQTLILQEFLGQNGGEIFMGTPNESDENGANDPVPGVGLEYCWSASSSNASMLEWANDNPSGLTNNLLPSGDYRPVSPMSELLGCTLNGDWKIRVIDAWREDNGYIFEWKINFNPDIIPDCSVWVD